MLPLRMLVDIHIHLDHELYNPDRDEVIKRAKDVGLKAIVTAGIDKETNRKALALSEEYDIVKAAVGIYPETAESMSNDEIEKELTWIEEHTNEIYAIGECGLDLHNGKDLQKQTEVFVKQIKLAKKLKKPLIVHSRKAEKETLQVLQKQNAQQVVLHCFSGNKKLIEEGVNVKYYFSIPANIIRSDQLQTMVKMVPLRQLLTETDGPYLAPYKNEDGTFHRNESAYIDKAIGVIADIKGITKQDCKNQLFMNFQKL